MCPTAYRLSTSAASPRPVLWNCTLNVVGLKCLLFDNWILFSNKKTISWHRQYHKERPFFNDSHTIFFFLITRTKQQYFVGNGIILFHLLFYIVKIWCLCVCSYINKPVCALQQGAYLVYLITVDCSLVQPQPISSDAGKDRIRIIIYIHETRNTAS